MSWLYPHSVTVVAVVQADVDGTPGNPDEGEPVTVAADFQAMTTGAMFERYGIELSSPARLYVARTSISAFPLEARVTFSGKKYRVASDVIDRAAGDLCDHAVVLLEAFVDS